MSRLWACVSQRSPHDIAFESASPLDFGRAIGDAAAMLKHNSYFEGQVQSVGFERSGRRASVGVIAVGSFHFGTDSAERMTVVSGELWAKLPGETSFRPFAAGTCFEVAAKSGFDVRADAPSAYLCEYL